MKMGRLRIVPAVLLGAMVGIVGGCGAGSDVRWSEPVEGLAVGDLSVAAPVLAGSTALYFHLRNEGTTADTIVSVTLGGLGRTSFHRSMVEEGVSRMVAEGPVGVGPGETVTLRPGGLHVMVEGLPGGFAVGDSLEVSILFARAGWLVAGAEARSRDVIDALFPEER
jgi:copper(I)-binding protein